MEEFAGIPYKDQPSTLQNWQRIYVEDVSELKQKVKELEADISNSHSVIESLGNRNQALKVENEGLKVELKGCEGDYKFEYEKRKELEAENERLKAWKTSWLLDKHYGLVQKVQELEADVQKWIKIAGENQKSVNQSAIRIRELESSLDTLHGYKFSDRDYTAMLAKIRYYEARIKELTEALEHIRIVRPSRPAHSTRKGIYVVDIAKAALEGKDEEKKSQYKRNARR